MTRFDMLHLWYGVWILWLFRFQLGGCLAKHILQDRFSVLFMQREGNSCLAGYSGLAIHMSTDLSIYMAYCFAMLQGHQLTYSIDSTHNTVQA